MGIVYVQPGAPPFCIPQVCNDVIDASGGVAWEDIAGDYSATSAQHHWFIACTIRQQLGASMQVTLQHAVSVAAL